MIAITVGLTTPLQVALRTATHETVMGLTENDKPT